jgi:F420H(2)-dependent biliverdin reductase
VKVRNLKQNDRVALALEDGSSPIIFEGAARIIAREETPRRVVEQFKTKYDWDIFEAGPYTVMLEITTTKRLGW